MMTEKRFKMLARSYGASFARWPEDERPQAEALWMMSPAARAALAEQDALDADLGRMFRAQAEHLSSQRAGEESGAALARLRAGIAGRLDTVEQEKARRGGHDAARWTALLRPQWGVTAGGAVMTRFTALGLGGLVLFGSGLWLGWMQATGSSGDFLAAFLMAPVGSGGW